MLPKKLTPKHIAFIVLCVMLVAVFVVTGITISKVVRLFNADPELPPETNSTLSSSIPETSDSTTGSTGVPETSVPPTSTPTQPATNPSGTAHVHDYSIVLDAKPATCSESGWRDLRCACGDAKWEPLDPLPHSFGYGESITVTCTTDGCTRYTCTVCGATEDRNIIPATGHDYQDMFHEATCTEDAYTVSTCSHDNCPEKTKKTVQQGTALGHKFGNWSQNDQGVLEKSCSQCSLSFTSEDLEITDNMYSSATDGNNNTYKVHEIWVGTEAAPRIYRYVITDFASRGELICSYDFQTGLSVTYTDTYSVEHTVVMPRDGGQTTFELVVPQTQPSTPTETTQPTQSTDPTGSSTPANPTDPTDPTDSTDTSNPTSPTDPTDVETP